MFKECRSYSVVLVTNEIFPYSSGGIGVLLADLLLTYSEEDSKILVLGVGIGGVDPGDFQKRFPNCDFVSAESLLGSGLVVQGPYQQTSDWHFRSVLALEALKQLNARGVTTDWVEFPDFGGLGYAWCMDAVARTGLGKPRTAVRLHGSFGLIRMYHGYSAHLPNLAVMDIERVALEGADLVVAHVGEIVNQTATAFRLESLKSKSVIQNPPVGVANGMREGSHANPQRRRAVFASKVDSWKNPMDFVRGVRHLESEIGKRVEAYIAAPAVQGDGVVSDVISEISNVGRSGLRWLPNVSEERRRYLLSTSVVVIPSRFEAFSLLAFEAALTGGRPLVSARNPAFADDAIWIHGENCWKYDGTVADLSKTLAVALSTKLTKPMANWNPADPVYWLEPRVDSDTLIPPLPETKTVSTASVILVAVTQHQHLASAIDSIAWQTRPANEVVLITDAPQDLLDFVCTKLSLHTRLQVIRTIGVVGLSEARNLGLRAATSSHVAFLDADDLLEPTFIERAMSAFSADSQVDVFVGAVACFSKESEVFVGFASGNVLSMIGQTYFSRYIVNWISSASGMVDRSLEGLYFDNDLSLLEDWDLWNRLLENGARFATDHQIGLWYRQHEGSMSSAARRTGSFEPASDLMRSRAWMRGVDVSPSALVETGQLHQRDVGRLTSTMDSAVLDLIEAHSEASTILSRKSLRFILKFLDTVKRSTSAEHHVSRMGNE